MNQKIKSLLKLLSIYVAYFIYTTLISSVLKVFGVSSEISLMFISDLVFFMCVIILYKDALKEGYKRFERRSEKGVCDRIAGMQCAQKLYRRLPSCLWRDRSEKQSEKHNELQKTCILGHHFRPFGLCYSFCIVSYKPRRSG